MLMEIHNLLSNSHNSVGLCVWKLLHIRVESKISFDL